MADASAIKEITDKLEAGVREIFDSEKYAGYLKTMSRFHNYSTRNTMLIHMQMPEATKCAGFRDWTNKFKRHVKKGEHGIKILAPKPFTIKEELEKLDPVTKKPILGEDGQPVMEQYIKIGVGGFKTVSVFDISQTEGEPLPGLVETLTGDVAHYELFLDTLNAISPLPIVFENLPEETDGECHFGKQIVIRNGMSQVQTICAIVHEMTHAVLHDKTNTIDDEKTHKPKDKRTMECEAESTAFAICQYYNIETGANSFAYIAEWSKTREAKELTASLDLIRKTTAQLIDQIDEQYRTLAKERGIDLSAPVSKQAVEVSAEQNYNRIDSVINNEPDEPEQTADEPQHDPIRERLTALSQAETPDAKYEIAFSALVDALCANEELLAVAATGAGWQKGAGRAAVFDGGYFETLIGNYSAELGDILSDKSLATRLNNTVRGEAFSRLDAIAHNRYILDEYADIAKSGRLETYETPYPEDSENRGVIVHLIEQLPNGGVHDYGAIFGYDPDDKRDHAINNHFSLKSFVELRESVFGKPETTITLNYKETEPVGSKVLRRLLYTDGMLNRELKRTRVEVLPPMGKYSIYAQHLSGVIGDDTLIHVGTDSGYLISLGVSRTRFEEQFVEAQIDSIFEKAPVLLDAALANPEQFARFEWAAITGRFPEVEEHNTPIRELREKQNKLRQKARIEAEKEEERQNAEKYNARIDEIATAVEQGESVSVSYDANEFDGKNPVLDLFRLYDITLPIRTQGWVKSGLAEINASGYRYYSSKHKGNSTTFRGYLLKLREAIQAEPIDVKRGRSQNTESKDGGKEMEYSELQKKGFETAKKYENLPLKERLNIIAQTFGVKSASVYVQPCTGKYRGQSDIMLRLEGGGTIGIGMRGNASAKKDSVISECVNNALAKYNPEIVSEVKERAAVALKAREAEDNYNAEQRGMKPYKFLNVELSDGGIENGYTGRYYATIAVDDKIIPFITTDLASDIERGVLTEYVNRANYFVAGGLKDEDADFVFNNVGHSSFKDLYQINLNSGARERAEKRLAERMEQPAIDPHLPDPNISDADMIDYGYHYEQMHPLSQNRAAELYDANHCIYLLYPDNTETMVFDREEILNHDGLCGIEQEDWERSPFYAGQMADSATPTQNEPDKPEWLQADGNRYGIYQIKKDLPERSNVIFTPLDELKAAELEVDSANYELVYTAPISENVEFLSNRNHILNDLYREFNLNPPQDFRGHSLSVSDVVVLKCNDDVSAHFVDRVGFVEIDTFLAEESHREAAKRESERVAKSIAPALYQVEKSPDTPTLDELMEDVNAGKEISLTDLSRAIKAEGNNSITRPSLLSKLEENKRKTEPHTKPRKKDGLEV